MQNFVRNQKGQMAIATVMIFSVVIAITMSSAYLYNVNQARYHAKIKQGYQMIGVMEGLARAVKQAYDSGEALTAQSGASCPGGQVAYDTCAGVPTDQCTMPNHTVCLAVNNQVCIERQDMGASYCANIFLNNCALVDRNGAHPTYCDTQAGSMNDDAIHSHDRVAMNIEYTEHELNPMKLVKASSWLKRMDHFYGSEESQKNIQAITGIFWQKAFATSRTQPPPIGTPPPYEPPVEPGNSVIGGHAGTSDPYDRPIGPVIASGPTTACGELQAAGTIQSCPQQSLTIALDRFTCPTGPYDPETFMGGGIHNVKRLCTPCQVGNQFCPSFSNIVPGNGGQAGQVLAFKQKFYVF
jgi:hypothetical protein